MNYINAAALSMTPELQSEADKVFAYWRREETELKALAYCQIADNQEISDEVRDIAKLAFEKMYDEAVKTLGLIPVLPEASIVNSKPKFIWRNGARVKVQA